MSVEIRDRRFDEVVGASLTFVTAARAGTEVVLAWQPASFTIPRAANAER